MSLLVIARALWRMNKEWNDLGASVILCGHPTGIKIRINIPWFLWLHYILR